MTDKQKQLAEIRRLSDKILTFLKEEGASSKIVLNIGANLIGHILHNCVPSDERADVLMVIVEGIEMHLIVSADADREREKGRVVQ